MATTLSIKVREIAAEWLGMSVFIAVATGTATGLSTLVEKSNGDIGAAVPSILGTALAFGFTLAALIYATAHTSGGQFNPAITLGLVLAGHVIPLQACFNILAQVIGAVTGSGIVYGMYPDQGDTPRLGANEVPGEVSASEAFLGEMVGTFALVFVVLETAKNPKSADSRVLAPLAIGLTVFVVHLFLIPFTSCSINPARSLGPAIVSGTWGNDFWVFMIAPLVGAILAAFAHLFFMPPFDFMDKWLGGDKRARNEGMANLPGPAHPSSYSGESVRV